LSKTHKLLVSPSSFNYQQFPLTVTFFSFSQQTVNNQPPFPRHFFLKTIMTTWSLPLKTTTSLFLVVVEHSAIPSHSLGSVILNLLLIFNQTKSLKPKINHDPSIFPPNQTKPPKVKINRPQTRCCCWPNQPFPLLLVGPISFHHTFPPVNCWNNQKGEKKIRETNMWIRKKREMKANYLCWFSLIGIWWEPP
jgi:hypothetical protein